MVDDSKYFQTSDPSGSSDVPQQWGDFIQEGWEGGISGLLSKGWNLVKSVLGSKVGKGILIGLAAAAIAVPLFGGFMAMTGNLAVGGAMVTTFEGGVAAGIAALPAFMLGTGGLIAGAIGGVAGGFGLFSAKQNCDITPEEAQAQNQLYERARAGGVEEPGKDMSPAEVMRRGAPDPRDHPMYDPDVDTRGVPPRAKPQRGGRGGAEMGR